MFFFFYYRKRGSASYIVRQWLFWVVVVVVERERERERERRLWHHWYHAEIASDHAYDYLDGAQTLRGDSFWACRVLELRSACEGAWRLSARLSSRVEWLMNDDGEVEALRSLVRLPWITQQHFVGMLQARRIDQVDVYFLFEWQRFCLWEQLGQRIPFRKRPCAM